MTATALSLVLALLASQAPPPRAGGGEPLPAGAPTDDYELSAWCYGAMSEYLDIYDRVKPDLRDIDKKFGSSVQNEKEPYSADMAAAHDELKILAGAVTAAEKASPSPISQRGAAAVKLGRSIWSPAEDKTRRELARAWLSWAMPDRCDTTARTLAAKSALLGQALKYNSASTPDSAPAAPPAQTPSDAAAPAPGPTPVAQTPPDAGSAPTTTSPTPGPTPPPEFTQPDPNGPLPDPTTPRSDR